VEVTGDAFGLRRSWRVRVETDAPFDVRRQAGIAEWLIELERYGREAFNVFPSHYERPPAAPVAAAVCRLRSLGATSGVSRESAAPELRFHVEARRWRGELAVAGERPRASAGRERAGEEDLADAVGEREAGQESALDKAERAVPRLRIGLVGRG
jgi:hypothetical protein